jgi:hypothetical protein
MWNPFDTSAYERKYFDVLDKHDANVNKRLEIAVTALEEIGRNPMPVTENEKRIYKIATKAIVEIYKLMVEVTQD